MSRATRAHTIRGHLVAGGLVDLGLGEATQKAGPDGHDVDGFSVRQHLEGDTLVVIAGAYGPNWLRTLAELTGRLESPHVKCTVRGQAPGLGDHEVLVRWSTSEELQARKVAEAQRQAPLKKQLREQQAVQEAEERRRSLEAAGQSGLF
ncbi:cell envelope integrity protein TolA [Streptomyces ferrugineus]|uniref:Cell envelope integrity protein TolA n=1 Tax=Streptomyces ferrugineus TaxID=1413221 RepID=A0A7M2SXI8_9ACTN|nr:cell envelope integrity protein TolA [Streptomyces ferrugineus]QOV40233.1 cell envelope integrity protein TolA [Streptomyces ferrugineus]